MSFKEIYYPESRFGGFTGVDGTVTFYQRVNALTQPTSIVVDIGCGRGAYADDPIEYRKRLRVLKGKCRQVIGIDVDPKAAENPFIDEFRQIQRSRWPLENEEADLCLTDNVLEHVPDPDQFFTEIQRVLKPAGILCIRTPNVLSYFGLMSKLVPNRQHAEVLQRVKDDLSAEDIFPTLYRCNTIQKIRRKMSQYGFEHVVYGFDAEPSYLSFSKLAYIFGVIHQRYAPQIFKVGIHAFGKKVEGWKVRRLKVA